MVESALTLLLFTVIVIGILDCSRVFFIQATIGDRVRKALRYGALHANDAASIQNIVLYGTVTESSSPPSFSLTRSMVEVTRPAAGTSDDHIDVRVSGYRIPLVTPFVSRVITGRTVSGTMPVETL